MAEIETSPFVWTVPSNASYQTYPENTTSVFTVTPPRPIVLDSDDWEVGITNANFPQRLAAFDFVGSNLTLGFHAAPFGPQSDQLYFHMDIRPKARMGINDYRNATWLNRDDKDTASIAPLLSFSYGSTNKRVKMYITAGRKNLHYVKFTGPLAVAYGFHESNTFTGPFNRSGKTLMFTATKPPLLKRSGYLRVEADIIRPIFSGDHVKQTMALLSIKEDAETFVFKAFNPRYTDLLHKTIKAVTIKTLTEEGTPAIFEGGVTVFDLHFRKKRILS